MDKLDYKRDFRDLYLAKNSPCIIEVPSMRFAVIDGKGDPNGEEFAEATAALYGFSYAVKMSNRSKDIPEGFYDYVVFPLEGVWGLVDVGKSAIDKSNYAYSIMIRQPDFLTTELFERAVAETKRKKPNANLDRIRYVTIAEGLCCQMLHLGSYDDEPASFEKMKEFCGSNGYERTSPKHREIYLSDPRKTAVDKRRTVLRFGVRQEGKP